MEDVTIADVTETPGLPHRDRADGGRVAPRHARESRCRRSTRSPNTRISPLGVPGAFVAASREFGVPAFDLFAPLEDLGIWRTLLQARVPLASERLLETARIEAGRPRYGVDMHEDTIPLEAGIESRGISFDKGCYVGQEVVIRILHRGGAASPAAWSGWSTRRMRRTRPVWQRRRQRAPRRPGRRARHQRVLVAGARWPARASRCCTATRPSRARVVRIGADEATVRKLP